MASFLGSDDLFTQVLFEILQAHLQLSNLAAQHLRRSVIMLPLQRRQLRFQMLDFQPRCLQPNFDRFNLDPPGVALCQPFAQASNLAKKRFDLRRRT
ncbi:MAG TPA: hypothetical protein VMB73_04860 [Acetobacteraceae bacterium]|nr:hypothetical protein [Acetobacteraceae bacterium]